MKNLLPFIGQLNRRVQIVEMIKTRNSTGEEEITHKVIASPYAMMVDVSGTEDVEGKVRHFINRHYTIRWCATFTNRATTHLLLIDGTNKFNIYHTMELGRRQYLKLLVKEYE